MGKRRKRWGTGAAACLLLLNLTACAPSEPTVTTTTTATDLVTTTSQTTVATHDGGTTGSTTVSATEATTTVTTATPDTTAGSTTTTEAVTTAATTTAAVVTATTKTTTTAVTTMTTVTTTTATTTPAATTATTAVVSTETPVAMNDPRITYTGRAAATAYMATMSWSGSGFELAVRGGTVKANLTGPTRSMDEAVWVAVYVNGERTRKIMLKEGLDEWYTLATDLPDDTVTTIRVVKLSEAAWGTATLQGLTVTGTLVTPTAPARRILCIGDSITCGFGVLGRRTDPFSTKTQDVTLTYGWLLADAFNAERHVISVSGYGVATANTGSTTEGILPHVYGYTALTNSTPWDHTRYQPDLILVNLGTNDVYGGTNAVTLKNGVRSFLGDLRAAHPNATIVWVYGLMRDDFLSDIQQTVEQVGATDGKIYFLPAAIATGEQEIGSADHPSDDAHARLAQTLQSEIAAIMGW